MHCDTWPTFVDSLRAHAAVLRVLPKERRTLIGREPERRTGMQRLLPVAASL